ncbi:Zinc finger BED domain-containing protein RICESLEEPER 4 [Rhynchospora pubera]|uniref:Zinc finger BED domain-containing protein RICESLEEPER 4 n=1 Tax=Rhynchospora pubera TaxID=906938 RepID=A0AAV8F966_9POAL|nr:Zinc finger BED domain-containing protein RICESLEEPER 4 [Rhynchospora pubera]
MSNIGQFEDSSRSKKGKEKVRDRPSNKRSKVWDEFVEIEQPDGTKKAKCLHCGNELCGDSKKGTSHLRRHLDKGCPKKKAKIAVSDSPECHENHKLNECQENHLGYDLHNDQELSTHRDLAYNHQRNRQLFVKMIIDNITMLEHVENPFLKEFALTLQPLYCPLDQRTVEKDCLTIYKSEKDKLKDKLSKLESRVSFIKDGMSNASPSPILSSTTIAVNESVTKLEKYLASCDEIVHFAFLLDPQLKLRFLDYCNGQGILDGKEVLERFCNLYIAYQNESIEISNNPKYFEHEPPELQKYWVSNPVNQTDDKFDVLGWWKSNELEYPILSRMARDILAIPITCSLT